MFGVFGPLGHAGEKALDFEGRRWVRLFQGDYSEAKQIMSRLDAEDVPSRLALPEGLPTYHVVVEVMQRWLPQARELAARE